MEVKVWENYLKETEKRRWNRGWGGGVWDEVEVWGAAGYVWEICLVDPS